MRDNNLDYDVISVGKETVPHRKQFSPEEIEKMQMEHTNLMLEADKKALELSAHKKEAQGFISKLLEEAKVKRNLIATKSITMNVECVLVPNHENGMMDYINPDGGDVVFSRRLTPDEKQMRENRLRKVMGGSEQ